MGQYVAGDVIEGLIGDLVAVLGTHHVATDARHTEHYRTGFRSGCGSATAVVFPQSLSQLWAVLKVCVRVRCVIIMQAAKTGLTEGSTPSGDDYDRPVVVVNTLAMASLTLINQGSQVVCQPGATLYQLEQLLKPLGRAPHSVIGSSCLGASIVGGVANNSGGALVKRGPAYTEMALFARVNEEGCLELVNHLGMDLGGGVDEVSGVVADPEALIARLESGAFVTEGLPQTGLASDREYVARVRDVTADSPARFNADVRRLFEASGCAGKLAVFAVRLDTFATPKREQTFYIGTNDAAVLSRLRRRVLSEFEFVPEVGEYMHREVFDIARVYGKDTFLTIEKFGTGVMPRLFALKGRMDAVLNKWSWVPKFLSDRLMQGVSRWFGEHLPDRVLDFRDRFEHHLILKMSDEGIDPARDFLYDFFAESVNEGDFFECSADESRQAFLHRFAAAGAAIRYQTMFSDQVGEMLALDIALRRNDVDWVEVLPESIACQIEKRLYYGHFLCHVFHQDYILKKGADAKAVKAAMLAVLDERGAKYPAEHNVGHLYAAEEGLRAFYRSLDPTNTFNPGLGQMDKGFRVLDGVVHERHCSCCG